MQRSDAGVVGLPGWPRPCSAWASPRAPRPTPCAARPAPQSCQCRSPSGAGSLSSWRGGGGAGGALWFGGSGVGVALSEEEDTVRCSDSGWASVPGDQQGRGQTGQDSGFGCSQRCLKRVTNAENLLNWQTSFSFSFFKQNHSCSPLGFILWCMWCLSE